MILSDKNPAAEVPTLDDLIRMSPGDLARLDIALTNLLCAAGLPGAEDMDIPEYLRRLNALTGLARRKIERDLPRFRRDPAQFKFPRPISENFFRIICLVTALKMNAGLHYNPERQTENPAPFSSKDLLINGLLSEQRIGTCASIPVVIVAVARRLGYPLFLAATRHHVIARWDGDGERFNIDASCPGGFHNNDDDHYRNHPTPMRQVDIESGYYLKNFTPADETAMFLHSRARVLTEHKRYEESLPAWAKCCFLAPGEPMYPRWAYIVAHDVLHIRNFGKPPEHGPDHHPVTTVAIGEDLSKLLSPRELGMFLSIEAHFHEVRGEIAEAVNRYNQACQADPQNPDYPVDRERYQQRTHDQRKIRPFSPQTWPELYGIKSNLPPKPTDLMAAAGIMAPAWFQKMRRMEIQPPRRPPLSGPNPPQGGNGEPKPNQ